MKKILFVLICILLTLFSLYFITINSGNQQNDSQETPPVSYEYNYFNPINQDFYYGNIMKLCNSIYYKVILDYNEYLKFKEYYTNIIDMDINDFENNLLILTITENESTKNLAFHQIYTDDSTLHIGLIKKTSNEEPNLNRGISIKVNKEVYRNNIDVFQTIENTNFMTNYTNIKKLSTNYTIENAINENCFVITLNSSQNITLFNTFINKVQNNQDAEIRILYNNDSNNSIIYDIKYSDINKKYYVCIDSTRNMNNKFGIQTYNYYTYDYLKELSKTNSDFVINNNTHNYYFESLNFPETNLSISYLEN